MSKVKVNADMRDALVLTSTLNALNGTLKTKAHLSTASRAAFDIMAEQFNIQTAALASVAPDQFHHVYEPEGVGVPQLQLWTVKLTGTGGNRGVSWNWRASKKTVPVDVSPTGKKLFPASFDTSKLNRIHVFVWKAPVMEYGMQVEVKPKLSPRKLLVMPNPNMVHDLDSRGPRSVVFTPHVYRFVPGKTVKGNFTEWFAGWWAGGSAQDILDKQFSKNRDEAFRKHFEKRIAEAMVFKKRTKTASYTVNSEAARQGKKIAMLLAGDMERNYIEMARKRRELTSREDDDE